MAASCAACVPIWSAVSGFKPDVLLIADAMTMETLKGQGRLQPYAEAKVDRLSWGRQPWFPWWKAEHDAARELRQEAGRDEPSLFD